MSKEAKERAVIEAARKVVASFNGTSHIPEVRDLIDAVHDLDAAELRFFFSAVCGLRKWMPGGGNRPLTIEEYDIAARLLNEHVPR